MIRHSTTQIFLGYLLIHQVYTCVVSATGSTAQNTSNVLCFHKHCISHPFKLFQKDFCCCSGFTERFSVCYSICHYIPEASKLFIFPMLNVYWRYGHVLWCGSCFCQAANPKAYMVNNVNLAVLHLHLSFHSSAAPPLNVPAPCLYAPKSIL